MVGRKDLDDQFVYKLLDTIYSNLGDLHGVHPRAKQWILKNATKGHTVPFHPGAIKFYKAKGVWTPQLEKKQQQMLSEG